MAAQQVTRWDDVANGPPMTFTSGSIYQHGRIEQTRGGWSSHRSRFDVVTPGPPAARSPNKASGSYQAVQAASMRLQSRLNGGTRYPETGYVLGGQAPPRQQYQDSSSSWGNNGPPLQNDAIRPHIQTGFHRVSYVPENHMGDQPPYGPQPRPLYSQGPYFKDWLEDHIYHCRDRLSQTLEDLRYVRRVYSRDRLEHYRVYDEHYYYGDLRTRLHCSEGRYGDERRHELHLPWDES